MKLQPRLGGDDPAREEYQSKIISARQELKTAGPIHRRDLIKHIRRMERELYDYDRYHKAARGGDHHGQ